MNTIRPYQVFDRLADGERSIHYTIPKGASGKTLSVSSLDTLILIAFARIHQAKSILEIGTSEGWTAFHLAANLNAVVATVDPVRRDWIWKDYHCAAHIVPITAKSSDLAPSPQDMVFIDGDHSYEGVEFDTAFALKCDPKVILWHDYQNPHEPENTRLLDELSETMDLTHIGDSNLVFWERK